MNTTADIKRTEETKRNRNWNERDRWRVFLETIDWVEAQSSVRRNDPRQRLLEQDRKRCL